MADQENETVGEAPGAEAPVAEAPAADAAPAATGPSAPAGPAPYQGQQAGFAPRRPMGGKRFPRRKVCAFCVDKLDFIDYKDTKRIRKFVTERGKLLPRRITGNCAAHQRMLTVAVKRARVVALLPFTTGE